MEHRQLHPLDIYIFCAFVCWFMSGSNGLGLICGAGGAAVARLSTYFTQEYFRLRRETIAAKSQQEHSNG